MSSSVPLAGNLSLPMAMPTGNTARTNAISRTDSEVAIMSKEEGRREIVYQMTMTAARKMLEEGVVTREEYEKFDTNMRQKYEPIFGSLFTDINLI